MISDSLTVTCADEAAAAKAGVVVIFPRTTVGPCALPVADDSAGVTSVDSPTTAPIDPLLAADAGLGVRTIVVLLSDTISTRADEEADAQGGVKENIFATAVLAADATAGVCVSSGTTALAAAAAWAGETKSVADVGSSAEKGATENVLPNIRLSH